MRNVRTNNLSQPSAGFTIVEVAAALTLLTIMLASVLVLMTRYSEEVVDMRLRAQAFEIARSNMELLLSENTLTEMTDYGTSETHPEIEWMTVVEPFYEPVTNRMWLRAVCSAEFVGTNGEYQEIELEHWITNLTAEQIKLITAQQKVQAEYMELLKGEDMDEVQQATMVFLRQEALDAAGYERYLKRQRRKKLEYLSKNGVQGYDEFVKKLDEEENKFLLDLGMPFDKYNDWAQTYDPDVPAGDVDFGLPM